MIVRRLILSMLVAVSLPSFAQITVVVKAYPVGPVFECDDTRIFAPWPLQSFVDFNYLSTDTMFAFLDFPTPPSTGFFDIDNEDDGPSTLFNIGCIRYSNGQRLQWFYQMPDGKFILSDRKPSQSDENARFRRVRDSDGTFFIWAPNGKGLPQATAFRLSIYNNSVDSYIAYLNDSRADKPVAAPSSAAPPVRRPARASVVFRTPSGRLVQFEWPNRLSLAPVQKPPADIATTTRYTFTLIHIRDIDATEEVVQIMGSRYIGNNTSVKCYFSEGQMDRPFSCSAVPNPSAATLESLFVLHHARADSATEQAYIRTPGGKWIAFEPYNNIYGDHPTVSLVEDVGKAYKFEILPFDWRFFAQ